LTVGALADCGHTASARVFSVVASCESAPVAHHGDAVDDIAIWVDPLDAAASTLIVTDKRGGLTVYDIAGRELQRLPDGASNNVDLRGDVPLGDSSVTLVAASRLRTDAIGFYRVDESDGTLVAVADLPVEGVHRAGLCMYRSPEDRRLYVFTADHDGGLAQWLVGNAGDELTLRCVRRIAFASDIEGCVADDDAGRLFVSEENRGIWCLDAEPDGAVPAHLVDAVGRGRLAPDVEGLALTRAGDERWLVASVQGRDEFVIYRSTPPFAHVATFAVAAGHGVDAVTHTDGLEIADVPMGPRFPAGLLVVQDDHNDGANQNVKLVSWLDVLRAAAPSAPTHADEFAP